jgi:DNA modification methylase
MTLATESSNLTILEGDVRQTLRQLPEKSIHCAITSPPYWALRSYLPKNHALKSFELGSEPTPEEYIRNMVGVFGEVWRVLRDDGTLWVNIGETFQDGNRVGIPERFAIAMQQAGWIWRDTVIWHKPAPMPSSVTGWQWVRCRVKVAKAAREFKGHERLQGARADNGKDFASSASWKDCPGCPKCSPNGGYILRRGSWRTTAAHEPIFMFAKTDKYFCDGIGAREEAETATIERNNYSRVNDDREEQFAVKHDHEFTGLTRNPRSVWRIASGGSSLKHYAMFPIELPARIIEVATPAHGVCAVCGAPWARIVNAEVEYMSGSGKSGNPAIGKGREDGQVREGFDLRNGNTPRIETLGWRATCKCGTEERTGATVLDPFGGSGTTAQAALMAGRKAVLCELNPEYVGIIRKRMDEACPLLAM